MISFLKLCLYPLHCNSQAVNRFINLKKNSLLTSMYINTTCSPVEMNGTYYIALRLKILKKEITWKLESSF